MPPIRRRLLEIGWRGVRRHPQRRYESSGHATSAEAAHHAPHHEEPVNESLGRGFYITLAAIPFSLALYKFSTSFSDSDNSAENPQPLFTRLISSYSDWGENWKTRNATHTAMVEQAAHDRNLFYSSPGSRMVDLKFPEIFNTGSPYNVPAGHSANLDVLIAHYQQRNRDTEEKKIRKLREAERIRELEAQAAPPVENSKKFFGIF